jgi:fatty acid desaturase
VMGMLLAIDWRAFLLYFVIPHGYGAWGIVGINFMQHDGTDEGSEWNHSRNFVGKAVNWLAFNNGFHTIHHMKPRMHWSLLPAEHAREVAPYIHPALDQESLLVYLWKTYGWPGKRTHYTGAPLVLPEEGPDEDWIPGVGETPEGVSLGAVT